MAVVGKLVLLQVLISVGFGSENAHQDTKFDAYCWRDFEGVVPLDALVVGSDGKGMPVYVGQVSYGKSVVPGRISTGEKFVNFEWYGNVNASAENAKILCTRDADKLKWISSNSASLFAMPDKSSLIKGGFESPNVAYIGRMKVGPGMEVGKIMCGTYCWKLYTANSATTHSDSDFEVLSYSHK